MRVVQLGNARRARHMTQAQVAEGMDTTQSAISRLEHRADLLLSTLDAYVAATGGILMVVAVYPRGDVVQLTAPAP